VDSSPDDLATRLSAFARELQRQSSPPQVLETIVRNALELVPGCDEGSISLVVARRRVESQAASSSLPRDVDALQEEVGQGPCLSAVFEQQTVRVADMASETRWPDFSRRASERGVGGMLSFQLFVEGDNLGALNLYARSAGSFDEVSERTGLMFAAHAAVAYSAAQRESALERALASRQLVGQAQGILMERHRLTAADAFARLTATSQARNVKLHEVARRLVETGDLPATG
jgi:hypothetical protein